MTVPGSAMAAGQGPWLADLLRQIGLNARLAGPVAASRMVLFLIVTADIIMVGRYDGQELAYIALAMAVQGVFMLLGFGMLIGTGVLTAQARGAGADEECGVILRVALVHALLLGGLFLASCTAGGWFFRVTGQDPVLAEGGGRALMWLAYGLPGLFVAFGASLFLEALGRPLPGVAVAGCGLVLNVGLNHLWIADGGGADGAAAATSTVRWVMALLLVGYVFVAVDRRYNLRGPLRHGWAMGKKLRRLGYALGLAQGLESAAFSALTLFAGLIGAHAVAAHQVVLQVVAFCFMAAIGVSTATAVHVGMAVGRGDRRGLALAGWAGGLLILAVMIVAGTVVSGFATPIGWLFTTEPALHALVLPALLVAACMLPTDGLQGVLMGALRGAGDVWVPTAMHLFSFIVVMAPLAAFFALGLDWGVPGLYGGGLAGVTVASALLALRFRVIGRRAVRRL